MKKGIKILFLSVMILIMSLCSCQNKKDKCTVNYILNGEIVESLTVNYGDTIIEPSQYSDIVWLYNGQPYDFNSKILCDIILIAKNDSVESSNFVDILSLTAFKFESKVVGTRELKKNVQYHNVDANIENQYIVMYKSQSEITFTIKLNNPKGESIDAIELTCDDPNAQIMVDGEYKPIQFNENSEGVKSRIVNWAQEDPYEKVYYIKTTSMDDINTLRVIDLKVNGEWQNQALSNDELKIYKMEEEDLEWVFMKNTPEYYQWKFKKSDKISNLVVKLGTELEPDENGVYTTVRGKVVWEYDYTFDGVTVHWKDERDIETVSWVYDEEVIKPYGMGLFTFGAGMHTKVWINSFSGTDLDGLIHINKESDETKYFLEFDGRTFNILTGMFCPEEGEKCYLYFGNSKYYINVENRTLDFVE